MFQIFASLRDGPRKQLAKAREYLLRYKLKIPLFPKQQFLPKQQFPSICLHGNFKKTPEAIRLKHCFETVDAETSLPEWVLKMEGMSGKAYRNFINKLVKLTPDARYLEIGAWTGSTAASALSENVVDAVCIDNWSQFGSLRKNFLTNIGRVLSKNIRFALVERDFRTVDYASLGKFNIYVFDGPHEEADHLDGIVKVKSALAPRFFLVVDDWNWAGVRLGTIRGILMSNYQIEAAIEIRTTLNGTHGRPEGALSDWHNGYFLAILSSRNRDAYARD